MEAARLRDINLVACMSTNETSMWKMTSRIVPVRRVKLPTISLQYLDRMHQKVVLK
jgi:hypothetical protein